MSRGFLESRRRRLAVVGRPMSLRRQAVAVTVQGSFRAYTPDQITGGIVQGDAQVSILDDEIAAAAWPGPPRRGDTMLIDGKTWALQGATPVHDGALLIGHDLWIRGGNP